MRGWHRLQLVHHGRLDYVTRGTHVSYYDAASHLGRFEYSITV